MENEEGKTAPAAPPKRGRGRPRKVPLPVPTSTTTAPCAVPAQSSTQILTDVLAIIQRDVAIIQRVTPTPLAIEKLSPTVARYAKTLATIAEMEKEASTEKSKKLSAMSTEELMSKMTPELRQVYQQAINQRTTQGVPNEED